MAANLSSPNAKYNPRHRTLIFRILLISFFHAIDVNHAFNVPIETSRIASKFARTSSFPNKTTDRTSRKVHFTVSTPTYAASNTRKLDGMELKKVDLKPSSALLLPKNSREKESKKDSRGVLLAVTVLFVLALSNTETTFLGFSVDSSNELNEVAFSTATRVLDASVPTSSSDYFAVAVGESIAGVIGAVLSVFINFLLRPNMMKTVTSEGNENNYRDVATFRKPIVNQALADGDYFIANSAVGSLLMAIGIAPEVAKLSSVFIAAVPSQLVKLAPILREKRSQEEFLMKQLLQEQQEADSKNQLNRMFGMLPFSLPSREREGKTSVDPSTLLPVTGTIELDFVEVFADVTRWLEYDVLKSEFAGTLQWNNEFLDPAITGAILGLLAAVSSRLYADVLYGRFSYGPNYKQEEVQSRTDEEWLSLYFTTAASAATLFGFYELSKRPFFRWIQGTLAGGVEGCIGSSSFDACLQTYIDQNAPGPSPEAQLRALVTNLNMVGQRLQDIAVDTTFDDVVALGRAWSVTFLSFVNHFLSSSLPATTDLSVTQGLLT